MLVTTLNNSLASCPGHNCGIIAHFIQLPKSLPIMLFLDAPTSIPRYVLGSFVVGEVDQQLRDRVEALTL